ncbi:hypothetical protein [Streptomyces sp. NPDC002133]|uniref:hypothetical protein n=1 Tax=Streptomyces sp. NPDC002133 TaxID=3154409 RepID=UPI00331658FB
MDSSHPDEELAGRCDLCGEPVLGDQGLCTHVRDSSFIHPQDPSLDGERPLVACSPEHLTELIKESGNRPYTEAELWAGKIDRVLAEHPRGLSLYALAVESGLTQAQIAEAAMWAAHAFGSSPRVSPASDR